ncbi:MAG: alkaline phosphatase D family protein [Pseudomonadota bacterium]
MVIHRNVKITRRAALASSLAGGISACSRGRSLTPFNAISSEGNETFRHGVASGDPLSDSVVIWTRVTPSSTNSARNSSVDWELATDENFQNIIKQGRIVTGQSRDWTVKATPNQLPPGAHFFYRFRSGRATSPTGRTKTLPVGSVKQARFAAMSCSNHAFGFFNVYDQIARRDDFDAVIHLGDYIYEAGGDGYGGEKGITLNRAHRPARELVSLADYRERHAQYKSDPSCQAMHRQHPLIAIWDDHEVANDSWKDGAEAHQPENEGSWHARKRAALQAYYEWMPVRDPLPGRPAESLFRSYEFGDLLTLTALETRLMARARPFEYTSIVPTLKTAEDIDNFKQNVLWDDKREILGEAQREYMAQALDKAKAKNQPWRLIANQIIMANVVAPDLTPHVSEDDIQELEQAWDQARAFIEVSQLGLPSNLDAWDGYPAARERFYDLLRESDSEGVIVLTGDTHTWWANDLATKSGAPIGVELGAASVTSPSSYNNSFLGGKGSDYALLTNRENKSVRYLSGESHGYIDLEVNRENAEAKFMAVDTVEDQSYNAFQQAAFNITKSNGTAKFQRTAGLSLKERFLF